MSYCKICNSKLVISETIGEEEDPRCINLKCGEKCPKCGSFKSELLGIGSTVKCTKCGNRW